MSLGASRPAVVWIQKGVVGEPIDDELVRKYTLYARHLRVTIVALGRGSKPATSRDVRLVRVPVLWPAFLGGLLFYPVSAFIALRLTANRRHDAIVCGNVFSGFFTLLLARMLPHRRRPLVMVEVHGDWRGAARLYGSGARRVLAPVADGAAAWALRRAERIRVVSDDLARQVAGTGTTAAVDQFIAFVDFGLFIETPPRDPPARPAAIFAGALERTKAPEVLIDAWRIVADTLPEAVVRIVGAGSQRLALVEQSRDLGLHDNVAFLGQLPRIELARLIDESTLLVLPSLSEGRPRVIVEAMARGRPVVASRVGAIPQLVADGVSGLLVDPGDAAGLAEALLALLGDPGRCQAMGLRAREAAEALDPLAEYEAGVARIAAWAGAGVARAGRPRRDGAPWGRVG